jgi:sugar phosphate isomerase/epimerase
MILLNHLWVIKSYPKDFRNTLLLRSLGYDFIEPSVGDFLKPGEDEKEFESQFFKYKESPLPVISCINFIPKELKSVGPVTHHDQIIGYAETAFRRAKQVKMKYIVFGSGGSRRIPDNWTKEKAYTQFVELVSRMAPVAKKYGIVIVLEPLNKEQVNFINSLAEGAEIVNKVNHPNLRMLADIYHMLKENEPAEEIIKFGKLLYHCHIGEKEVRSAPGIKGDDFKPYLNALKQVNYSGGLSLECVWNNFDAEVASAIGYLKKQIS